MSGRSACPATLVLLLGSLLLGAVGELRAQEDPWSAGVSGTGLLLRQLDGVKRVLLIGAHPDDEDTALMTALARGMGAEAAYLSLTRGEGGQNLIGPELGEGLGLLRTGELLAARHLDGGTQFFSRAYDFGFSKNAQETFRFWPREEVLADVVWVIRSFRPQIVVAVFSGTPSDGHGHHQAAGILAREAFDVAGDPARFPEQLASGVTPWAPLKLYRLTRRNPQEGSTVVETGVFDPLLGRSWFQVAMESRSQHRSQDMGVAQPLGPRRSTLALVESRVPVEGPDELFAGVDTTMVGLAAAFPEAVRGTARGHLLDYHEAVGEAREALDPMAPWESVPALGRASAALGRFFLLGRSERGGGYLASPAGEAVTRLVGERMELLNEAILRAAGVVVDARLEDDLLVPGESVEGVVEIWNGGPLHLRSVSGALGGGRGWSVEPLGRERRETQDLPPGQSGQWRFRLQVPDSVDPSRPYYLEEAREGAFYQWPSDPSVWGRPSHEPPFEAAVGLRLAEGVLVLVSRAAHYRGVDKATGEYVEPVLIVPALSVSLEPGATVVPMDGAGTRTFSVRIESFAEGGRKGKVALELPAGWTSEPAAHPFDLAGAGAEAAFEFRVVAPEGARVGIYSVQAVARTAEGESFAEEAALVDYDHVGRALLLRPARAQVTVLPLILEPGFRVGYVMGSGDAGPEALRQMGATVELLGPGDLRNGGLNAFDAVVLGIRAYETRPELAAANQALLDYARAGGTVVVQYSQYEFPQGGFAPYPVAMARPHDRVTDETAPVTLLDPDHPVFRKPNVMGPSDFDGWVQERGLYFLSEWDEAFTPLLEMADPGEEAKRGGLLVARVGEGAYVYTGLAFFRQFPAGVPGAYRLFANLVSLRGEDLRGR